jgi:hypothetical protein
MNSSYDVWRSRIRRRLWKSLHSGSSGGHFASVNTVNRIRTTGYWWPYMNRDVKSFVDSCDQCQRTGTPSFQNHWPLTPIIPLAPFEKWGIDFIGPISPVSSQKRGTLFLPRITPPNGSKREQPGKTMPKHQYRFSLRKL